jgi:hypothetical protein
LTAKGETGFAMILRRWFAWTCLALVLVAEICLFRAYRDKDAIQVELLKTEADLRQTQAERDTLRYSSAGLLVSENIRLRRINNILTNKLVTLQSAIRPILEENASNAQHLATARLALQMQQAHLDQLQDENDTIVDASVTIISQKTCINNLRLIDDAKQSWAQDNDKPTNAVPTAKDLLPYFKGNAFPTCPDGGTYYINAVDEVPTCSIPGHTLLTQ